MRGNPITRSRIWLALACLAIGACQGGSRSPAPKPVTTPMMSARPTVGAKPIIDFGRGAGGFPITSNKLPTQCDDLVTSLSDGYRARVESIDPSTPTVVARAESYPHVNSLAIDLSGAKIKSDYRPSSLRGSPKLADGVLHVDQLTYKAIPLEYVDGKTNVRIAARDVSMAVMRGRGEQSTLVMTDAKDGHVDFEVQLADLRTMMLASAKANAGHAGYNVTDVSVNLTTDGDRAMIAEAHVAGWWLLVPSKFKIAARIDIDDDFNAHFSNVSCGGENLGGSILAGFIDRAMKKYEGKVMPLATFPGNRIKIRDFKISIDDSLRVYVAFGS